MDEKKYKLICVRKGKTNYARTNNRKKCYTWILHLNSLKQFVRSERASEVLSSTTKTLSVSLYMSVQFRHLYRKLHNRN